MILLIFLISLLGIVFLIQGSLEDLFERQETQFQTLRTEPNITDWLSDSGKHGRKSSYRDIGKAFETTFDIRDEAGRFTGTFEEAQDLRNLMKKAKRMVLDDPKTIEAVEVKLNLAEKEEKKEVKRQESLIVIEELQDDAEKLFEAGDLDSLIDVRDEVRKYKEEFPEIFTDIDSKVRGLRLQATEIRREKEQEEARIERQENKLEDIQSQIPTVRTLGEIYRLDNRLEKLSLVEISEAKGLIDERLGEIEAEREERTRIIRKQQEESRIRKEELLEKGYASEF